MKQAFYFCSIIVEIIVDIDQVYKATCVQKNPRHTRYLQIQHNKSNIFGLHCTLLHCTLSACGHLFYNMPAEHDTLRGHN